MSAKNWIIIALLLVLSAAGAFAGAAHASVYYVSPHGRDSAPGTKARPWATFLRAMLSLKPGDTLYLEDGVYYQSLDVTVSGRAGKPVFFKAASDGRAVVDALWQARALRIAGRAYVEVDGITFRHSGGGPNAHGLDISNSSHLTLRRDIADGSSGYNSSVISLCGVKDSLLVDCAGSGQGRVVLNILGCSNITVRRCWLGWSGPSTGGGDTCSIAQIYDSSHVLMENNIGVNLTRTPTDDFGVWAHYRDAGHDRFLGNVVYHTLAYSAGGFRDDAAYGRHSSYNLFEDNVAILPVAGVYHSVLADASGTDHHVSENDTYAGDGGGVGFLVHERPGRSGQETTAEIINCSFYRTGAGIDVSWSGKNFVSAHKYNNFYRVGKCLLHEKMMSPPGLDRTETCGSRAPGYDTAKYGRGGYLMVPPALRGRGEGGADIGATVLFRYRNGRLTGIPLWPWPMEGRILAEFGVSPTWQAKGGIWKTLKGIYHGKTG